MKKNLVFLVAFILVLSVNSGLALGADSGDAGQYYPLKAGNYWQYKVTYPDNSTGTQTVLVMGQDGSYLKTVAFIENSPFAEIYYLENEQGLFRVKLILASGISTYDPVQPVLPSKMAVGDTWSWESTDLKQKETGKLVAIETVTTPAGTYEAMVLECEGVDSGGTPYVEKTWFAKGVGYVKDVYTEGTNTIVKEMVAIGNVK